MEKRRYSLYLLLTWVFAFPAVAGTTVYIPLGSGNSVIAVEAANDSIVASFTGVENSHGLVATPDGEYLIAGSLKESPAPKDSPGAPTSKLFIIHPAHGHVMLTIPVNGWTHHQAITPDGRYVLSSHGARGYISVVDLQRNQVIKTINTGPAPNYIVVTRDGKRAYVTNSGNGTISEVDLMIAKVIRTLEAGPAPEHMVATPDGKVLYVINSMAGTVSGISVDTGKIVKRYELGKALHGLDIGDDGRTLFVSSKADQKLFAVDTANDKVRSVPLAPAPYHLNTIHGTGKIYVSSRGKPEIWVIDQNSLKIVNTIKLPGARGEGHQMAIVRN